MVVCMILYSISIMSCYHYYHHKLLSLKSYHHHHNYYLSLSSFHIHLIILFLLLDNDQAASFKLIDATLGERKLGPSVAVDSYGVAVGITNKNPFDVRNPHPRYYQHRHHHYKHYHHYHHHCH